MNHTIDGNLKIVKLHYDDFLINKNRRIRIWTPSNYDKNSDEHYKVIYMWDGQNLFDEETSYAGEWKIDETIEGYSKEIRPCIVVGLDCSPDRLSEYLPKFSNIAIDNLGYKGDQTLQFLTKVVMPYIEKNYNVSDKREDTAIGGSSMGGLMSIAAALAFPDKFSKIYAFSPAFPVFKFGLSEEPDIITGLNNDKALIYAVKKMNSKKMKNKFKIAITSGGVGGEAEYYKSSKKLHDKLIRGGWKKSNVLLLQDKTMEHNEYQWATFFPKAYRFFNEK